MEDCWCFNEKGKSYKNYGARGIIVCHRWNSFENFFKDMGCKPSKAHSIDRKDNDKGYSPSNCRWATDIEQANNTKRNKILTIDGDKKTLAEWCRKMNMSYTTVRARLRRGWESKRALSTPVKVRVAP